MRSPHARTRSGADGASAAELCAERGDLGGHRAGDDLTARQALSRTRDAVDVDVLSPPSCSGSQAPVTPLLYALTTVPVSPLNFPSVTSTHFATLLFAHLLRYSPRAKMLARSIVPQAGAASGQNSGAFFVPADGGPPPAAVPGDEDADGETDDGEGDYEFDDDADANEGTVQDPEALAKLLEQLREAGALRDPGGDSRIPGADDEEQVDWGDSEEEG